MIVNCRRMMVSISILFMCLLSTGQVLAESRISVFIDGIELVSDLEPIIVSDRTLLPMRVIFEQLGCNVDWDNKTQTVTAKKDMINLKLMVGSSIAYNNIQPINLDVPAQIINNHTYVPVRFVSEALGYHIYWNNQTQSIYISTKGEDPVLSKQEQCSQMKTWIMNFDKPSKQASFVQQTKEGDYIVTGRYDKEIFFAKLDLDGNIIVEKTYGSFRGESYGECVQQTNDNGFIIVGYTEPVWNVNDFSNSDSDMLLEYSDVIEPPVPESESH